MKSKFLFQIHSILLSIFTDHTSVIAAGGQDSYYLGNVEVIGNRLDCNIPDLPFQTYLQPSVFQLGQNIFLCGGTVSSGSNQQQNDKRRCFKLVNNEWIEYNLLISNRTRRVRLRFPGQFSKILCLL